MALHLGFDPGGTGKKLAHVSAAADGDSRLFTGHLRTQAFGTPVVRFERFPFVAPVVARAVDEQMEQLLRELLDAHGARAGRGDLLACAVQHFGGVTVSIDAPCGFALPGWPSRETERSLGPNFNTPSEQGFVSSAQRWMAEDNQTPLQQRVYWKLLGFSLFAWFGRTTSAAEVAAAAALPPGTRVPVRLFESFPSETYRQTQHPRSIELARSHARRRLVNLRMAPLPPVTLDAFSRRLGQVARWEDGAWARSPGKSVGDCLDAFASMVLGPCAPAGVVKLCGDSAESLRVEGAIAVLV
ncbi:MAG: hypothetical protein FJ086_18280 [Deltaproteobacteria bacterium]|nr:hypothetical protein [Deltaproteobacteria bacterium]